MLNIEDVNTLSDEEFVAKLGDVYEHAPWVMEETAKGRPFSSRLDLYSASVAVLKQSDRGKQLALLCGHPELARPDLNKGQITADSEQEQNSLDLMSLSGDPKLKLNSISDDYRDRHGFPAVVCVREHPDLESVVYEIERRINRASEVEFNAALGEVMKIGWNRIRERVNAGRPRPGYLTTHALDTANGTAAAGLGFELSFIKRGVHSPIIAGFTDNDGRSDGPILDGSDFTEGEFELIFRAGDYLGNKNPEVERKYFGDVPIRVLIDGPDEHYHVPLILSHWGYTTYRGS